MNEKEILLIAISGSESQKGNYVLIFEEVDGFRRIPIVVGRFEAQAIAIELEQMKTTRPMTHDLFKSTVESLGASLQKICIYKVENDTFFSKLILKTIDGATIEVESRTSDAVALAVRFQAPMYTSMDILNNSSLILDGPSSSFNNKRGNLDDYSIEELQAILDKLVKKEDYKSAIRIRNAIKRKKDED